MSEREVIEVSLGAPERDFDVIVGVLGERVRIKRVGTAGDLGLAKALVRQYDGKVSCISLGGVNYYYRLGERKYPVPGAAALACAERTPVVDGSGVKRYIEPEIICHMQASGEIDVRGHRVLFVSVLDRYDSALRMRALGADVWAGDPLFALGVPLVLPISAFTALARVTMPLLSRIPLRLLYPLRDQTTAGNTPGIRGFSYIVGDIHLLRRRMPSRLDGVTVISASLRPADEKLIESRKGRAIAMNKLEGMSLAANVLEAVLVAILGRVPRREDYLALLEHLSFGHYMQQHIDKNAGPV
ncbi:MAG: quinate 5-dehydrogenase [Bacillota bacterium]